jgi:hypothetical protein
VSRATVRWAIADWLTGKVDGINTVYSAAPALIPGDAFFPAGVAGVGYGAVCYVHIPVSAENRRALGGAYSGKKRVDHTVELHVLFRSIAPAVTAGGDRALDAADRFDTVIDNLVDVIRSDRNAGDSTAVWQWGENLNHRFGEPVANNTAVEIWAVVTTTATEWATT